MRKLDGQLRVVGPVIVDPPVLHGLNADSEEKKPEICIKIIVESDSYLRVSPIGGK